MSADQVKPIHYLLPIFPAFQLLDVAGPLDILNLLSLTHSATKSITLTLIASTLDSVPTKPISPLDSATGKPKWTFSGLDGLDGSPANTTFNQSLTPDTTFASYLSALEAGTISDSPSSKNKPIDVLLIPGGVGTRMSRTDTESGTTTSNVADLVDFIPKIAPRIRHSIVTVCTGSAVLSQTGLLNSRRATTNMMRFDMVKERAPNVRWRRGRRYVRSKPEEVVTETASPEQIQRDGCNSNGSTTGPFQREIWTSAGISAGIDVMLAFVAEYYGGVDVARDTASKLEYEWREIQEDQIDPMYNLEEDGSDHVVDPMYGLKEIKTDVVVDQS